MCNFLALNSFFVSFFFSQCFTLTLTTAASCRLMAPQLLKFQESRHRSRPKNDAPYPWRPARHRAQDRSECVDLPRDQAAFGKRPRGPGMQQCEGRCIPRSPVSPATWFACPHRYFRKPPTPPIATSTAAAASTTTVVVQAGRAHRICCLSIVSKLVRVKVRERLADRGLLLKLLLPLAHIVLRLKRTNIKSTKQEKNTGSGVHARP